MRRMGGLRKYMPITYITSLIGTLALVGTPFFSGFYSKDSIIDAAKFGAQHGGWVQQYAYWAVLLGVFVTSFYSFRLLYMTFHGEERFRTPDAHNHHHDAHDEHAHDDHGHHGAIEPHESPLVVTIPLILLAIPSVVIGYLTVGPMLFGHFFDHAIVVNATLHPAMGALAEEFHGATAMALNSLKPGPLYLALAGFGLATYIYLLHPALAPKLKQRFAIPARILEDKYGFDTLWIDGFAGAGLKLGKLFWRVGDAAVIDGIVVNGTSHFIGRSAAVLRKLQSGYLYHYAFAMILGLIALLGALLRWPA
jgi:NADH-quinone oxidoreductase subunit L